MTPRSSEPSLDAHAAVEDDDAVIADAIVVDGEVVSVTTTISDVPFVDPTRTAIEASRPGMLSVAARNAAVVTTGFVAGAIATAVVARKAGVLRRPAPRSRGAVPGRTQRYLVDVQLLGDR